MNLDKLSPAPWEIFRDSDEFAVLARNAFDVAMRRGWTAMELHDGFGKRCKPLQKWRVSTVVAHDIVTLAIANDPFTALVEADRWYRENIENAK